VPIYVESAHVDSRGEISLHEDCPGRIFKRVGIPKYPMKMRHFPLFLLGLLISSNSN